MLEVRLIHELMNSPWNNCYCKNIEHTKPVHRQRHPTGCMSFAYKNLLWIGESVDSDFFQRLAQVKKAAETTLIGKTLNPLKL